MYIFYILIILVIVILFFVVDNKKELFNKLGLSSVITGISLVMVALIINFLFSIFMGDFNIIKITSIIFNKFINVSIFFVGIGLVMIIINKIVSMYSKKTSSNS